MGVAAAYPRLKPGLELRPGEGPDRGTVVKDPQSRRYYRFDELEGFILKRLDGEHSALDIQVELAVGCAEEFALEEIQEFIDGLREKGLVEGGGPLLPVASPELGGQVAAVIELGGLGGCPLPEEGERLDQALTAVRAGRFPAAVRILDEVLAKDPLHPQALATKALLLQAGTPAALRTLRERQRGGRRRHPLYFQVPLFNPDRLLSAVEPAFRWVFSRGFLVFFGMVAGLALWTLVSRRHELVFRPSPLGPLGLSAALMGAVIVSTALHEWAHGLTCKHFGGRVHEAGFMVILFFIPALYVDVSDAWMFRSRRQRVAVGLAGPLFDLFTAAAAVALWGVLAPGLARELCRCLAAASGGTLLLNLNPLLRLDGYYILSDAAGIPNLRQTAAQALGNLWRGRSPGTGLTPRGRGFLMAYGLLSAAYLALMLGLLGKLAFHTAARLAGLWGPALLLLAALFLLRRTLAGFARGVLAGLRGLSWRHGLAGAVLAAGFWALLFMPVELKVQGPASVDASRKVAVRSEIPGKLAEILVREGDLVRAGQVVARLDESDLAAQAAMTAAEVAKSRAQLAFLEHGPERERVAQAREEVRAHQAEVAHLVTRRERLARLRDEGLVAADQMETLAKELTVREGALRAAVDEAALVAKGFRPEQIGAARAEVRRLETQAADIARRLERCVLTAPVEGRVVTEALEQRRGDWLAPGGLLLEVADTRDLKAEVQVLESEISEVVPGREVRLRFSAFPDRLFAGRVREVAPVAHADSLGRAAFRVRCSVDDPGGMLKPGMTGAAKILAGELPLARVWLRRGLRMIDPALL